MTPEQEKLLEAELAEVRKAVEGAKRIYKNHNEGRECLCPYCCNLRPAIDAAMKEEK